MKMKAILFFVLILFSLVSSIAVAAAQSSAANTVVVAPSTLSFAGKEGQTQLDRTLTFVGNSNQTVTVTLTPTDLYDNNTGQSLSASDIEITPSNFTIAINQTTVTVSLNISQTEGGTYQGALLLTTAVTNPTTGTLQIAVRSIGVSVVIQPGTRSLISTIVSYQFLLLAVIMILVGATLAFGENDWPLKNLVVVGLGVFVTSLWAAMLIIYGFSAGNSILTTVGTIVMIPFFAFVINYVNNQISTQNDRKKTARGIENEGNTSDINMVRSVLAELETHSASFKPDPYERHGNDRKPDPQTTLDHYEPSEGTKNLDLDQRILYNESGKISRKVWDDQCKQGMMSELPLLELGLYYNFVNIYNGFYSYAVDLTRDKTNPQYKTILDKFEAFRSAYGELETVLYVHLSYYMGMYIKKNLSPLPIEYPRVNRIILTTLMDYDILDPTKYPGNLKDRSGFRDFFTHAKERFENLRILKKYFKYRNGKGFKKTFMKGFPADKKSNQIFVMYFERMLDKNLEELGMSKWNIGEGYLKEYIEELRNYFEKKLEGKENWMEIKFITFIPWLKKTKRAEIQKEFDAWEISAHRLRNIFNRIYHPDDLQKFYKASEGAFGQKLRDLEESVKKLPIFPKKYLEEEKKSSSIKQTKTLDGSSRT
jgi:hypothetical protein